MTSVAIWAQEPCVPPPLYCNVVPLCTVLVTGSEPEWCETSGFPLIMVRNSRERGHSVAATLGSLWRKHRRDLPRDVQEPFLDLLLILGQHIRPAGQSSCTTNISEAKSAVRDMAKLLERIAVRGDTSGNDVVTCSSHAKGIVRPNTGEGAFDVDICRGECGSP